MFTHVVVGSNDLDRAQAFYDAVMGELGIGAGLRMEDRIFYRSPTGTFAVCKPIDGNPATFANGGTIGLAAPSDEAVAAAHAAAMKLGGTDEGAPGIREKAGACGAYLRDPDGNKLCFFHGLGGRK